MLRRFTELSQRAIAGFRRTFHDFMRVLALPFRGGFRPIEAIKGIFREIIAFFIAFVRVFDLRRLPSVIARDSKTLVSGGQALAHQTTSTATGFATMVLWSPITIGRWVISLPGRTWFFIRTRTKFQLLAGFMVTVIAIGGVGWPLYSIVKEKRRDKLRKTIDERLESDFSRANVDGVKHHLSVLHGLSPIDPVVNNRLSALESGEADPTDFKMARLLMRSHYGHGQIAEASREAGKYLRVDSEDWEANLILADAALRANDRKLAIAYSKRLVKPRELSPWACFISARLFNTLGDRDGLNRLFDYVTTEYVPLVRPSYLMNSEPIAKLQFIELYNLALQGLVERPELKSSWVPVQEVCHSIALSKDASAPILVSLAQIQEKHLSQFLRQFVELRLMTEQEHRQYVDEIESRIKGIWIRVRMIEPKNPTAFVGMAMQAARASHFDEAVRLIDEGISKCGNSQNLVEKRADILRRTDPLASLDYLEAEHKKQPATLEMCRLIGETAIIARRPDRAIQAVNNAKKLNADATWIWQIEAEALLMAGRPTEAAGVMQKVLPQIQHDPVGSIRYVRTLAASGAVSSAEQFLLGILANDPTSGVPTHGADALAKAGQMEVAIRLLKHIVEKQPGNGLAQLYLGDCIRQTAENKPGGWDQQLAREAINCFRRAADQYPKNLRLINEIAWLELVALQLKREALETIEPMRNIPDLPAAMLETVGAVLVANGSYDTGRAALERSIQLGGHRATTLAFLADAYRGLNRSNDSLLAIRQALTLPKSNPRDAELINEIRQRIDRASP